MTCYPCGINSIYESMLNYFEWQTVVCSLQWRHNEHNGVSNQRSLDCLLNRLFTRRSKKTPKLRVTGFCDGNSPVTGGELPAQRVSYAENVSVWWRHHAKWLSSRDPLGDQFTLCRYNVKPSVLYNLGWAVRLRVNMNISQVKHGQLIDLSSIFASV